MSSLIDFSLYFSESEQQKGLKETALRMYQNLLLPNYDKYIKPNMNEICENHCILFDFQTLKSDADKLNTKKETAVCNGTFYQFLLQKPAILLSLLSCAAANCYFKIENTELNNDNNSVDIKMTQQYPKHNRFKIIARIINFGSISALKDIKSHSLEKYVSISGTIIRIGRIKPLVISMDYECHRCHTSSTYHFAAGKIRPIISCPNSEKCTAKNPRPLIETAICIDYQKIRLQELSRDETGVYLYLF